MTLIQTSTTMSNTSELPCIYAALILDDEIDITGGKIRTILKADAGCTGALANGACARPLVEYV